MAAKFLYLLSFIFLISACKTVQKTVASPTNSAAAELIKLMSEKNAQGCYAGSTNEKDCESSMRGASYATSEVTVCADNVMSWDRGWDAKDEHVWGADKAGYVFDRLK